jgi:WD40 repeat protein
MSNLSSSTSASVSNISGVYSVAYSPDNKTLSAIGKDGTLRIWEAADSYKLFGSVKSNLGESRLAYSPDGNFLINSGLQMTQLWEVANLRLVEVWPFGSVSYTCDNKLLSVVLKEEALQVWDVSSGQLLHSLVLENSYKNKIRKVKCSPDGKTVIATDYDKIFLAKLEKDSHLQHFASITYSLYEVEYSPDSKKLAVGTRTDPQFGMNFGDDGSTQLIEFWYIESPGHSGFFKTIVTDHLDHIYTLAFSPDGKKLASGEGGQIITWNLENSRQLSRFHFDNGYGLQHSIAFSPDGNKLLAGGNYNSLRLWNTDNGQLLHTFSL